VTGSSSGLATVVGALLVAMGLVLVVGSRRRLSGAR
jgi:LPXTG-motif cell wall-anchored protein